MRMKTVSAILLLFVPFAHAEDKGSFAKSLVPLKTDVVKRYADKIGRLLPKGWTLKPEKSTVNAIRDEPVEWYNPISLPTHNLERLKTKGYVHRKQYVISLSLFQPVTQAEVNKWRTENAETAKQIADLQKRMKRFCSKGTYFPTNDDERRLFADYRKLQASQNLIPDSIAADATIFSSESVGGVRCVFYSDAVRKECQQVRKAVVGIAGPQ